MEYKVADFENNSICFENCDKLKKVSYHDEGTIGDEDKPCFAFQLAYENEAEGPLASFQIGLKEVIYLRNALNSFIEINNTNGIDTHLHKMDLSLFKP